MSLIVYCVIRSKSVRFYVVTLRLRDELCESVIYIQSVMFSSNFKFKRFLSVLQLDELKLHLPKYVILFLLPIAASIKVLLLQLRNSQQGKTHTFWILSLLSCLVTFEESLNDLEQGNNN